MNKVTSLAEPDVEATPTARTEEVHCSYSVGSGADVVTCDVDNAYLSLCVYFISKPYNYLQYSSDTML